MQPAVALKARVRVLAEEDYEEEMRFRRRKRPRWWSALLQVCGGWRGEGTNPFKCTKV